MHGPVAADKARPTPSDPSRDLREERDRFVGFAFAAADLLLEVSSTDKVIFAVGAARALTAVEPVALIGRPFRSLVTEADRGLADAVLRRAREEGRATPVVIAFLRGSDGASRVTLSACRLPGKTDSVYLAAASARPVVAAAAAAEAKRDAETGLLDPASFGDATKELLANPEAIGDDVKLTLLHLRGLDELRARSGENVTSLLLDEIGSFLRTHAIGGTLAGRLASDKFGLVRAEGGPAALASEIERLARSRDPQGRGMQVGETAVALTPGELTPDDAARALAFTLGRFVAAPADAFSIASLADGFRAQIADTVARISHLKRATIEQSIDVAFQPIVALEDRKLSHFEMLARFEQNQSPSEMILFAEGVGMIEEIDLRICQRAIAVLQGLAVGQSEIAINISGKSLGSDAFVQSLMQLLAQHGGLRKRILFEITESTTIADLPRADRIIAVLRQAGHRICLDDFGAGAASFSYLQGLSVDYVKIDGAYVGRIGTNPRDWAILRAMVSMCRDLNIGTIAEMVEREDQVKDLLALGVKYGQGFLLGRPAPVPVAPPAEAPRVAIAAGSALRRARRKGEVARWE